jgi:putative FmdB family regulatory protein
MPTYEYQCDACEHNFDEFQSMSDKPLKKCPKCGKSRLRRVFGAGAAIIFKGSGFYQTDYRSESYKQAAKAEQESAKPAAEANGNGTAASPGKNGSAADAAPAGGKAAKSGKTSKSGARAADD